jgi:CubicO group peptidase (beta-lactamase class C family)
MPESQHPHVISKNGFTGCFMAVHPKKQIGVILLSNSTYPRRREGALDFKRVKEKLVDLLMSF